MGRSCRCDFTRLQSNIAADFCWCDFARLQSRKSKLLALESDDWHWKCAKHVHVSYVTCESKLFADKPGILTHFTGLFSNFSSVLTDFTSWNKGSSFGCKWTKVLAYFSSVFPDVAAVFAYIPSVLSDVAAILAHFSSVLSDVSAVLAHFSAVLSNVSAIFTNVATVLANVATVLANVATVLANVAAILPYVATVFADFSAILTNFSTILSLFTAVFAHWQWGYRCCFASSQSNDKQAYVATLRVVSLLNPALIHRPLENPKKVLVVAVSRRSVWRCVTYPMYPLVITDISALSARDKALCRRGKSLLANSSWV